MIFLTAITRERDAPAVVALPSVLGAPEWATRRTAVALATMPLLVDGSADDMAQLLACSWRRTGRILGKTLPARALLALPEGMHRAELIDVSGGVLTIDGRSVTRGTVDPVFYALAMSANALPTERR
jgi:hypothetical protein